MAVTMSSGATVILPRTSAGIGIFFSSSTLAFFFCYLRFIQCVTLFLCRWHLATWWNCHYFPLTCVIQTEWGPMRVRWIGSNSSSQSDDSFQQNWVEVRNRALLSSFFFFAPPPFAIYIRLTDFFFLFSCDSIHDTIVPLFIFFSSTSVPCLLVFRPRRNEKVIQLSRGCDKSRNAHKR